MKENHNEMCLLVLLYEFPAETRLTVYRRLDNFDHEKVVLDHIHRTVLDQVT